MLCDGRFLKGFDRLLKGSTHPVEPLYEPLISGSFVNRSKNGSLGLHLKDLRKKYGRKYIFGGLAAGGQNRTH